MANRSLTINVRLTPDEYKDLRVNFERYKKVIHDSLTLSDYIRDILKDYIVKPLVRPEKK